MTASAVWDRAVQALQLFAADPIGLGGVCVRAGAGPVRDAWLRLLLAALPPDMPVRRVPLNTGDDRLLGGVDLAATLHAGRMIEQKGLLAEADGGIAILPMAERIEPGTAARLRMAMDQGTIMLQRDGLSRSLPARFGTVLLDEGADDERVPVSLLDRIAFLIDLTDVTLRDAGVSVPGAEPAWPDPDPRSTPWPGSARPPATAAPAIDSAGPETPQKPAPITDAAEALTAAALALGVDSLRIPLFALRAARTAARLDGRDDIAPDDLALAAGLVLAPRATRLPAPEQQDSPPEERPPDRPEPPPDADDNPESLPDQPLEDLVLEAALATLPPDLLAQLAQSDPARGAVRTPGRAGAAQMSVKRGRPVGTRQGEPRNGARLHLLETLKAAAPWQAIRRQPGSDRFQVRREDFRIVRYRQRIGTTTIFAVDASGSAAMQRLGEAKGAVELLLADCYVRRDQVALIGFRGQGAQVLLPPTGSLLRAKRSLAGLPGGGPTPLAAGIDAAVAMADVVKRSGRTPVITILTDARANIGRDGTGGRPKAEAEALASAECLRATGVSALLVDTSPRPNPFAKRLAEAMRARYVPLPYADAGALSRAVRAESAA